MPTSEFSRTTAQSFALPGTTAELFTAPDHGGQHNEILQNFTNAILDGQPLIAPAVEGARSVELANAMLLSTWLDQTVTLPLDAGLYLTALQQRAAASTLQKRVVAAAPPVFRINPVS